MSFYDWCIKRYLGKDSAAGDLAGDMKRSGDFPKSETDKKIIERYLRSRHACDDAMRTFRDVFSIYQARVHYARTTD